MVRKLIAIAAAVLVPTAAHAAPEEIQVYIDDLNRPGGSGVDLHVNYVPIGDGEVDYPGQQPSLRRLRLMPELKARR